MLLTLFFDDRIETLSLPENCSGRYLIGASRAAAAEALACIEGRGGRWELVPLRGLPASLGRSSPAHEAPGSAAGPLVLSCPAEYVLNDPEGRRVLLLTEPAVPARSRFVKLSLPGRGRLLIGRGPHCDIRFNSPVLSARHAWLTVSDGNLAVRDEDSTNGVYVNGRRVFGCRLHPGDLVFIAGLRIVCCGGHLALSPPDGRLSLSENRLVPWHFSIRHAAVSAPAPLAPFHRPPRFLRAVDPPALSVDPPPSPPSGSDLPLPLVLGSSLSLGLTSAVMLVSAVSTGNTVSVWMGAAMLTGSLIMPAVTRQYESRQKKKRERLRQTRYRAYLEEIREQLRQACRTQEEILRENAPSPAACAEWILQASGRLWERSVLHEDLLKLRAGLGEEPLSAALSFPEQHFSIDDDPLRGDLQALCAEPNRLCGVPVTWSADAERVFGACGSRRAVRAFAIGLLLQLAALYAPDELKLVFVGDCSRASDWNFVRHLPHIFGEGRAQRYLAQTPAEARELYAVLEPLIAERLSAGEAERQRWPCYVCFFPDPALAAQTELYRRLLALQKNIRMSVFAFADTLPELPRETAVAVRLEDGAGRLFRPQDLTGGSQTFLPDPLPDVPPLRLSRALADLCTGPSRTSAGFPETLPFLRLFGAGKTAHLNCAVRWQENDPSRSLAAAVGTDRTGQPVCLDLHERFHGPHALVAGMTGSGKSEWLITYVLSLAVSFSPQEVAFVLIDYKGGGMAGAFADLPHTAGIMTNLDGSGISRARISIESELRRRQALFAGACRDLGVGSIDIYGYQRRVREGRLRAPLPHLFIICDEFAELKASHPEFLAQLVSTARIGRSLGVHLILATQKPGGVVDDQILSNCRARVCLKVQDRSDSMEMLGCPDAAALTDAGRFYLQAGSEHFTAGQAAWAGAPYLPADRPEEAPAVSVIDSGGRTVLRVEKTAAGDAPRQQDAVIRYLQGIARESGLRAAALWQEPLAKTVSLTDLLARYPAAQPAGVLAPVLGEGDDPANQKKFLLRLPLSEGHTALFGMPGSGKTDALTVLLYSAIRENPPEALQLCLLDFDAGTLAAFLPAPHTKSFCTADDEAAVQVLANGLRAEAETRRKKFLPYGGDYNAWLAAGEPMLPRILTVVAGFTAFYELLPDVCDDLCQLARDGARYGIHLLLAANTYSGVPYRMLQHCSRLLTLQQSDPTEYSVILGRTDGMVPAAVRGRGLIRNDALYKFQTASVCSEGDVPFAFVRAECARMAKTWERQGDVPAISNATHRQT